MSDADLIDYLCHHPLLSRFDDESGGIILTGVATIGRGVDYRAALIDLIANDRAKSGGIPCARERSEASIGGQD
jgi:hypothetical protein